MTTAAVDRGVADQAWTVLQAMMSPEYIQMVCNVNGGVPARKSVMDGMEQWQEGGRLYLYREQLEAGISYLRPITPGTFDASSPDGERRDQHSCWRRSG